MVNSLDGAHRDLEEFAARLGHLRRLAHSWYELEFEEAHVRARLVATRRALRAFEVRSRLRRDEIRPGASGAAFVRLVTDVQEVLLKLHFEVAEGLARRSAARLSPRDAERSRRAVLAMTGEAKIEAGAVVSGPGPDVDSQPLSHSRRRFPIKTTPTAGMDAGNPAISDRLGLAHADTAVGCSRLTVSWAILNPSPSVAHLPPPANFT
jgi:hypothetical protein